MTRTPTRTAIALLFVLPLALSFALLACGGSDNGTPGKYQATCNAKRTCDDKAGLACINGLCTKMCNVTSDCAEFGPESVCDNGHCYDTCIDTLQCPDPLVCTMAQTSPSSTCRPPL